VARLLLLLGAVSALACAGGCGEEPPAVATPAPQPSAKPAVPLDPSGCGNITGLVTWVGPLPEIAPVPHVRPRPDGTGHDSHPVQLANAPHIDRFTRGVDGVVVFLRGVNPVETKWDLSPVEVEFRDLQLVVKQGPRSGRTGFVRRGDSVTMRSREPVFHSLRARGAAFFALAFPDPDAPLTHTFDTCGRVELTSAAGYYWQAADLFVCDHPYYAVTDADGRFDFKHVPAGEYDLVAWHPNWVIARTERNPETVLPSRLIYAPPLEQSRSVVVSRGRTGLANLTLP
jgi:hypothetical protein